MQAMSAKVFEACRLQQVTVKDQKKSLGFYLLFIVIGLLFFPLFATATEHGDDDDDPEPIEFPGQVNIAVLLDVHSREKLPNGTIYSTLKPSSLQQLIAAVWAVRLLNNQSEPNATKIGISIYDTCGSMDVAVRQIHQIIKKEQRLENPDICNATNDIPLLGVIGLGETRVLVSAAIMLNAFSIPLIVASPGGDNSLTKVNNVLYTAPEMASQVTSVLGVVRAFQWRSTRIISSNSAAMREFVSSAAAVGVKVTNRVLVVGGHIDEETFDRLFEKPLERPLFIVALLEPEELHRLSVLMKRNASRHHSLHPLVWVVASPSLDRDSLGEYVRHLGPGIFVEPHSPEMAGFQPFFEKIVDNKSVSEENMASLVAEYNALTNRCSSTDCHANQFHQVPGVAHVAEAASALAAGLRILTLDSCHVVSHCAALTRSLAPAMIGALHKLGLSFRRDQPPEIEGARLRFTDAGRLVTVHSHVVFFNMTQTPTLIGWFSEELGVSLVSVPGSLARARLDANEYQQMWAERVAASSNRSSGSSSSSVLSQEAIYDIVVERVSHGAAVRRAWAAAVLALACIGLLAVAYVLVYLLTRSCGQRIPSEEPPQPLGTALLVGIAALYAVCVLFVLPPGEMMCGWRLVGHSTALAFCYAVLLAQALALRLQATLGLGGSLDTPALWLVVLLALAPQVAVSAQWWATAAPLALPSPVTGTLRCAIPSGTFVALHAPAVLLLVLTALFAVVGRSPWRSAHEPRGRWLFLAAVVCAPVWVGWAVVTCAALPELQEPAACAHLLTVATVVALAVFVPRVRSLKNQAETFRHKKLASPVSATTVFSLSLQPTSTLYSPSKLIRSQLFPGVDDHRPK